MTPGFDRTRRSSVTTVAMASGGIEGSDGAGLAGLPDGSEGSGESRTGAVGDGAAGDLDGAGADGEGRRGRRGRCRRRNAAGGTRDRRDRERCDTDDAEEEPGSGEAVACSLEDPLSDEEVDHEHAKRVGACFGLGRSSRRTSRLGRTNDVGPRVSRALPTQPATRLDPRRTRSAVHRRPLRPDDRRGRFACRRRRSSRIPTPSHDQLLTLAAGALATGQPAGRLRNWCATGKLACEKRAGEWLLPLSELLRVATLAAERADSIAAGRSVAALVPITNATADLPAEIARRLGLPPKAVSTSTLALDGSEYLVAVWNTGRDGAPVAPVAELVEGLGGELLDGEVTRD